MPGKAEEPVNAPADERDPFLLLSNKNVKTDPPTPKVDFSEIPFIPKSKAHLE